MSLRIFFLIMFFLSGYSKAQTFQNLVPNGSFETYTQCPSNHGQIYNAAPWTGPRINSSDYNNSCSSQMNVPHYGGLTHPYPFYLDAKDGFAYAGIFYYKATDDYREYLQVALTDSLLNGICYYVEFYAANYQGPPYGANNVSANLSNIWYNTTTLSVNNSILNIPAHITNYGNPVLMDTVKWHKISGLYQATGNEKYLLIGNFANNTQTDTVRIFRHIGTANSAYMFIDAVSVYSINPTGTLPWSYRDTVINKGDSVFIGNKIGGLHFKPLWYNLNGTFIDTNAGVTVKPLQTTKYYVKYEVCSAQRIDTVKVTVLEDIDVAIKKYLDLDKELIIYPTYANENLIIRCDALLDGETFSISILDNMGNMVQKEKIIFNDHLAEINVSQLMGGMYLLQLNAKENNLSRKFMIVDR